MPVGEFPSPAVQRRVEALLDLLARDPAFGRVRRLMEVDWSQAETTVEAIGLPRLLRHQARKLRALAAPGDGVSWSDVADAIRWSERHDTAARDALWWLGELSFDPLLRASGDRR